LDRARIAVSQSRACTTGGLLSLVQDQDVELREMTGEEVVAGDSRWRGHQRPARAPGPTPPEGVARLEFRRRGAVTEVARLFQQGALRVLRPNVPGGEPACAVLLNTSGGIVGGDVLEIEARLAPGAAAMITTQAAEKVYRSAGALSTIGVRLALAADAWLEWLPQETILFDRARLRRRLVLDLARSARLLAADLLVFGRRARGERFQNGFFHDRWEVRSAGRLVWADALRLAGDPGRLLDAPFGFAGAGAAATAIYVAPDAEDRLELARALIDRPDVQSGATCLAPVLIVRWLGEDPACVRHALQQFCARFRHAVAGLPERTPVIWRI
jgi:urease accessory protein